MPRTTLRQIADHLQLAPATVSQVLSGKGNTRVSDGTRKRILDAVNRLGYRPSRVSTALRTNRTYLIGLLVHGLAAGETNVYLMAGIEETLQKNGFNFTIARHLHQRDIEEKSLAMLEDYRVDGIIYIPSSTGPCNRLVELAQSRFPIAATGRTPGLDCSQIHMDHVLGGRMVIERLVATGVRRPVFIRAEGASIPPTSSLGQRLQGFREAYVQHIGPWDDALVISAPWKNPDSRFGYEQTRRLLETGADFDAIVCTNDMTTIGAADALAEAGRAGVTLSGYDNLSFIRHLRPRIVTVDHQPSQVGQLVARRVLDLIELEPARRSADCTRLEPSLRDYRFADASSDA